MNWNVGTGVGSPGTGVIALLTLILPNRRVFVNETDRSSVIVVDPPLVTIAPDTLTAKFAFVASVTVHDAPGTTPSVADPPLASDTGEPATWVPLQITVKVKVVGSPGMAPVIVLLIVRSAPTLSVTGLEISLMAMFDALKVDVAWLVMTVPGVTPALTVTWNCTAA